MIRLSAKPKELKEFKIARQALSDIKRAIMTGNVSNMKRKTRGDWFSLLRNWNREYREREA